MAPAISVSKVGGNSLGLYLPKDFVTLLDIKKGDEFDFDLDEKHYDGSRTFTVRYKPLVAQRDIRTEDWEDVGKEVFTAFYSGLGIHPGMTKADAMDALDGGLECGWMSVQETLHSNGVATHYEHSKGCTFDGTHCANCRKEFTLGGLQTSHSLVSKTVATTIGPCCDKPERQDSIEPEECDMGYGCNAWRITNPVHKVRFFEAFEAEAKKCWGDDYKEWLYPEHLMD